MFGIRTLYGVTESIEPSAPELLECPPPQCPPCNPDNRTDAELWEALPETWSANERQVVPSDRPTIPGLPASAIAVARRAVEASIAECPISKDPYRNTSVALLHLTITVTSGRGHIREAWVYPQEHANAVVADCLSNAARKAGFEWTGADGEITLKLPVSLEDHP